MIVEVFVSQGEAEDALGQQGALGMQDQGGGTWIGEALVDLVNEPKATVDFPQQQASAVAGEFAAVEVGLNFAARKTGNGEGIRDTLCHVASLSVCTWVC